MSSFVPDAPPVLAARQSRARDDSKSHPGPPPESVVMRIPALVLAVFILIAALPLILRLDSALRSRQRGRALIELGRIALAAAAAAVLFLIAARAR